MRVLNNTVHAPSLGLFPVAAVADLNLSAFKCAKQQKHNSFQLGRSSGSSRSAVHGGEKVRVRVVWRTFEST